MPSNLPLYLCLVAAVALQRMVELRIARFNTRKLLEQGAVEASPDHYRAMQFLHGSWLLFCGLEAVMREQHPPAALAGLAIAALLCGQALRFAAMTALGGRWTTRILVLPQAPPVAGGIYRWVRHPNYLGVILEMAALPLVYGGFATAIVFSAANLLLHLAVRIPAEEAALTQANNYAATLSDRGRFLPRSLSS